MGRRILVITLLSTITGGITTAVLSPDVLGASTVGTVRAGSKCSVPQIGMLSKNGLRCRKVNGTPRWQQPGVTGASTVPASSVVLLPKPSSTSPTSPQTTLVDESSAPSELVDLTNQLRPGLPYHVQKHLLGLPFTFSAPAAATSAFVGGHLQVFAGNRLYAAFADPRSVLAPESPSLVPTSVGNGTKPIPEDYLAWVASLPGVTKLTSATEVPIGGGTARVVGYSN
jgi:hypothetical protein